MALRGLGKCFRHQSLCTCKCTGLCVLKAGSAVYSWAGSRRQLFWEPYSSCLIDTQLWSEGGGWLPKGHAPGNLGGRPSNIPQCNRSSKDAPHLFLKPPPPQRSLSGFLGGGQFCIFIVASALTQVIHILLYTADFLQSWPTNHAYVQLLPAIVMPCCSLPTWRTPSHPSRPTSNINSFGKCSTIPTSQGKLITMS